MRKLIVTNIMSLDGYYEGPGGDVMALPMDHRFDAHNAERLRAAGTLVLGRRTYDLFKGFWPQMADHPDATPAQREISVLETAVDKVVVSDTLADADTDPWRRTGSLAGDLLANALLVQTTLDDRRQGRLFAAVIAAATADPDTARALERFYDTRIAEWTPCVDEAIERGEVPAATDGVAVIRAVSAPLYYHLLTRTDPIGRDRAILSADAAACAAAAGVFS